MAIEAIVGTGWDVVLANLAGIALALWLAKRLSVRMDEQTVKLGEMNTTPKVVKEALEITSAMDNGQSAHDRERLKEYDATLNEFKDAAKKGVSAFAEDFPKVRDSVNHLAQTVDDFRSTLGNHAAYLQSVGESCTKIEQTSASSDSVQNVANIAARNAEQLGEVENRVEDLKQTFGQGISLLNQRLEQISTQVKSIQELI
tara:strand:+ start:1877 stop:2479 length:603 start_codon:yes stop_codon:yes gene_type:complete